MKVLTKAEEDIMQILWEIKKGFVKDIIDQMPEPKPAYNTVSTIVRILESKGFVKYNAFGKSHEYFPVVDKADYSKQYVSSFVSRFFEGSFEQMVSFFAKEKNLSLQEVDELLKQQNQQHHD